MHPSSANLRAGQIFSTFYCRLVLILYKFSCNSKRYRSFANFIHCKYFSLVYDLSKYCLKVPLQEQNILILVKLVYQVFLSWLVFIVSCLCFEYVLPFFFQMLSGSGFYIQFYDRSQIVFVCCEIRVEIHFFLTQKKTCLFWLS